MNKYEKAYKILEEKTPLNYDCGSICSKVCCTNSDNQGMLLFPHEEDLYRNDDRDWYKIVESKISLSDDYTIKLLICNGKCFREVRPLACRIFPLMPYINEEGFMDLHLDLRGLATCPLIYDAEKFPLDKEFIDLVYDAFEELISDDTIVEFIELLSEEYDNTIKFLYEDE